MNNHQTGIFERLQKHLTIFVFDLKDKRALKASFETLWEDLNERLLDWHSGAALTVTIGFGLPLFEKLGKASLKPKALRIMPTWERDAFDPKKEQGDLLVQICSNERSVNFHVERAILAHLEKSFALKAHHEGFGLPESRGQLGFVDGTGNPKGDGAYPAALIGDEEKRHAGGTYMVVRKIREDVKRWEALSLDEQERRIGRRKADSAKLEPRQKTPASSHVEKSSFTGKHGDVELLRRSIPYGSPDETGLIFICYVRSLDQFETIKNQMVSPKSQGETTGKDGIHDFSTPVSGGYYFIPPKPAEGGFLGDFLA